MKCFYSSNNHSNTENWLKKNYKSQWGVGICKNENGEIEHVHYENKGDDFVSIDTPLTFSVFAAGKLYLTGASVPVKYKLNDNDWQSITCSTTGTLIADLQIGDIISFKSAYTEYRAFSGAGFATSFSSDRNLKFYAYGNINSLLKDTDTPSEITTLTGKACLRAVFKNLEALYTDGRPLYLPATTLSDNCYADLFYGCTNLTNAPELPALNLTIYCYSQMFVKCSSLVTAPDLPAINLGDCSYHWMFYNCTSLKYVKAMFITTPSTSYTSNWMNGVLPGGTFVKNSAAQWNVSGIHGIPTGWTVETASA